MNPNYGSFTGEAMTDAKTMLVALKEAIRRAIVVLNALRSSDARYLALGSVWAGVGDDPALAYGYGETVVRVQPTAREISQAEIVSEWLTWLGARDSTAVKRLGRWARGTQVWLIADLERCSPKTVVNRIDRSVAAILKEFGGLDAEVPVIEEPHLRRPYRLGFSAQDAVITEPSGVPAGHVYIGGVGLMRRRRDEGRWKQHRDGSERIDERRLAMGRAR